MTRLVTPQNHWCFSDSVGVLAEICNQLPSRLGSKYYLRLIERAQKRLTG